MSYAVKELFLTLQGEGVRSGRRAVFLRFAGCNLWSGREEDREKAVCRFCDTDFVGTDGENGAKYASAGELAAMSERLWGEGREERYIVLTGGEPMLQVDDALVEALHGAGAVLLPPRPQVAPGKAQEHRAPPGADALALQGQEHFLDGIAHA